MARRRARVTGGRRPDRKREPAPRVSLAALGRALAVSEKAVRLGEQAGRMPTGVRRVDGRIEVDLPVAIREWHASAHKMGVDGAVPAVASGPTLVSAQIEATQERARLLRAQNDLREGKTISVDAAAKEAYESARVIRERMLNIPSRLAPDVAGESDPRKVFILLDAAIREALTSTAAALLADAG